MRNNHVTRQFLKANWPLNTFSQKKHILHVLGRVVYRISGVYKFSVCLGEFVYQISGVYYFSVCQGVRHKSTNQKNYIRANIGTTPASARYVDSKKRHQQKNTNSSLWHFSNWKSPKNYMKKTLTLLWGCEGTKLSQFMEDL